jgi:DNA repair protein RecO (recombination protein O)
MEWTDEAIVLTARRHGESAAIVTLLTREHGRHAGLVPGGAGKRSRGLYEAGNFVRATWRARLPEHLGHFACELAAANAARLLDEPLRLAALAAAAAVADSALPERAPHPRAYAGLLGLMEALTDPGRGAEDWAAAYAHWELDLLAELGFGLDLSECAATGTNDRLTYVSPKSGRAVSAAAGEPYRDRLLALPGFLLGPGAIPARPANLGEVLAALALTGHFLARDVFAHGPHPKVGEPAARRRLIDRLGRQNGA